MTKDERFHLDMITEFRQICRIAERNGMIIQYKTKILKLLEQDCNKNTKKEDKNNE